MENLNSFEMFSKSIYPSMILHGIQNAQHVKEPFSDTDILNLQDAFLCNGIHYIKVDDVVSGRAIVELFLQSLNYYKNTGCLTVNSGPLKNSVSDLYSELLLGGHLDTTVSYELEEFFLEQFYYEFIWIEATPQLIQSGWALAFFKQMTQFKLDHLIPILVISYKQ